MEAAFAWQGVEKAPIKEVIGFEISQNIDINGLPIWSSKISKSALINLILKAISATSSEIPKNTKGKIENEKDHLCFYRNLQLDFYSMDIEKGRCYCVTKVHVDGDRKGTQKLVNWFVFFVMLNY